MSKGLRRQPVPSSSLLSLHGDAHGPNVSQLWDEDGRYTAPGLRCTSCWTPGRKVSNQEAGDETLERPHSARRRGSHFTSQPDGGQSYMTANIRSSARLGRLSGKILRGTIFLHDLPWSAPQYQAEGREMIWDSPLLREHDGRESRIGIWGGLWRLATYRSLPIERCAT